MVRRQLEGFRSRTFNDDDLRKIDLATDRPERVNRRIVNAYVEAIRGRRPRDGAFVAEAIDGRDANACIAAFVLAREAPEGPRLRWVRDVLAGLSEFPDAALATLRGWRPRPGPPRPRRPGAQARFAVARAEAEVAPAGSRPPRPGDLERRRQARSPAPGPAGRGHRPGPRPRGAFDAVRVRGQGGRLRGVPP